LLNVERNEIALVHSDAQYLPTNAHEIGRVCQAENDDTLIALWLHGRPDTTQQAYRRDAGALRAHVAKPLRAVTIGDLQSYATSLSGFAPASQARRLASVKSLFAFGHKLGYLAYDTGRPLQLPRLKDRLAERIIEEADAQRLIALEPNPRNHVLLRLLYTLGLRISEACGLCWRDLRGQKPGGVAAVHGKGGKTRHVVIPPKLWKQIAGLKREAAPEDPVLRSRLGGALDRSAAHRVVKAACARAGLSEAVSAHWLRHCAASHAMDHGCPPHVVAASLGHASLTTTTRYLHARPGDGSANYLPE
jgi:integrase/recombinase XerD